MSYLNSNRVWFENKLWKHSLKKELICKKFDYDSIPLRFFSVIPSACRIKSDLLCVSYRVIHDVSWTHLSQLVWSSPSLTHPSVSSYACLYLHYPQMTLSSLIACYIFILCAFFLVHFYLLPSLGNSYLSFKIPPKYHFLWETFFVSQTELKDPPPCPDSCLCISTPAPPMLYTKYVKWICLLTVETSLRLETIFSSFYSQQLTQSLVHGNCSVSVCRVNKWVDGWVDEWRDVQAPRGIPFPSIPLLHPSLSFQGSWKLPLG